MISIEYTPSFIREAKSLEMDIFEEMAEKIELFKDPKNHESLKVHKLHGKLRYLYAFSVNHRTRVIFEYVNKKQARFHDVGRHDIYE